MAQTQTREIRLGGKRLTRDVIELNGFWAAAPSRVRLVFEEELHNGLWQLILYDLEGGQWRIGSYIDGYENRFVVYDLVLARHYDSYIEDTERARNYDVTNRIIVLAGGEYLITLPDQWRPDVVVHIPALCGAGYPLAEPVYLGTDDQGHFYVLDCAAGLYEFAALDELEDWIRERECPEGHQFPVIHWWEWHITRRGEIMYSEYIQPSPEDVIKALRQYLT